MEGQDVSLQDVARAAGVSPATVSRALNGRAGVRAEVRTRVSLVADGLGYRPNRAAKNLAGGRTSLMALVLGSHELTADPYAAAVVQSVARAAREADEGLMLLLDTQRPNESVANLVADGLVEGVIVSAAAADQRWVEELLDARMPTVLLGAHPTRLDVAVVEVENRTSSARMVGHLLDSGCRRVATIAGDPGRVCTTLRLDGYRDAHHQRQLEPDPELVFDGDYTYASARRVADRLLAAEVDAVFAGNDEMATAVIHAAIERGIDIPDELSVAGFDGLTLSRLPGMTLSTVEQPFDEMARRAVATLVDLVEGLPTPMGQLVDPRLILGSTTRSVRPTTGSQRTG